MSEDAHDPVPAYPPAAAHTKGASEVTGASRRGETTVCAIDVTLRSRPYGGVKRSSPHPEPFRNREDSSRGLQNVRVDQ